MNLHQITDYFNQIDNISFALIFGSYASGKQNNMSDLDIGVYYKREPDILIIGKMISDCEERMNTQVDFITLNDIYKSDPKFAFEIFSNHKLLFTSDEELYIDFKRNCMTWYFDFEPWLTGFDENMRIRIREGKFGTYNYVR